MAAPRTSATRLTIEQLASEVGMTVRNIREYQSLGLLAPPVRSGRAGVYDERHVQRIERIRELRAAGFRLDLIGRLLESSGPGEDEQVALARAIAEPFQDEQPELITRAAFVERFAIADDATIERAVEVGLIRELTGDRLEVRSPRLARVGDAMVRLGLSLDEMLTLQREVLAHQDAVAALFLEVFREHAWAPFEAAGAPPEGLPAMRELLELVRPRALDTVIVAFQMSMDAAVREIVAELARAPDAAPRGS